MDHYLDNVYAAAEGVLLSYQGRDVSLRLPMQLSDMPIHTIGAGAVMESKMLQQVIVPRSVRRIGSTSFADCEQLMNVYIPYSVESCSLNAFQNCPHLINLYVYDMEMSERSYSSLCAASRPTEGSVRLASDFPNDAKLWDVVAAAEARPANLVPSDIPRLFTSYGLKEEKGALTLARHLDGFSFSRGGEDRTESDAVLDRIANDAHAAVDTHSEEMNDRFFQSDKIPPIRKTAVFTFDDSRTRTANGKYYVFAAIRIGYHFWQSATPVVFNGKRYFIYRRHYLTALSGLNYIRKEVAVFSASGPILNQTEAQKVYAKYKLLSIL